MTTAMQKKNPRYDDATKAAVKAAKAARGTTNGAPGGVQYLALVTALGDADTPKKVVAACGVRTEKALREMASGESDKESLKALVPLRAAIVEAADKKVSDWLRGRWIAAMAVARVEQLKAQA